MLDGPLREERGREGIAEQHKIALIFTRHTSFLGDGRDFGRDLLVNYWAIRVAQTSAILIALLGDGRDFGRNFGRNYWLSVSRHRVNEALQVQGKVQLLRVAYGVITVLGLAGLGRFGS